MTHHHTDHEKSQDETKTHDGLTAPQDVDNPSQRTTPPTDEQPDPERLERAREEQDRTIAT